MNWQKCENKCSHLCWSFFLWHIHSTESSCWELFVGFTKRQVSLEYNVWIRQQQLPLDRRQLSVEFPWEKQQGTIWETAPQKQLERKRNTFTIWGNVASWNKSSKTNSKNHLQNRQSKACWILDLPDQIFQNSPRSIWSLAASIFTHNVGNANNWSCAPVRKELIWQSMTVYQK